MYTESFNDFIGTVWGDFWSRFFHDLLTVQYSLAEVFSYMFRYCWDIYIFKNSVESLHLESQCFLSFFKGFFLNVKKQFHNNFAIVFFFLHYLNSFGLILLHLLKHFHVKELKDIFWRDIFNDTNSEMSIKPQSLTLQCH